MAQYTGPQPDCQALAQKYAAQYHIPPSLLYSLIIQESGCNPKATGSAGEEGLTQIIPGYHPVDQYGNKLNPFNPDQAVSYTAYLLKTYYDKTKSYADALWIYNAGSGNYDKGVLPSSTVGYIKSILARAGLPVDSPKAQALGLLVQPPGLQLQDNQTKLQQAIKLLEEILNSESF